MQAQFLSNAPMAIKKTSSTVKRKAPRRRQKMPSAKFALGQVVRHRFYPFRGVVYDIDPVFSNTEEWWLAIPEDIRPRKDQPYYHLLAENEDTEYIAYVSEQNLLADRSGRPLRHPQLPEMFAEDEQGRYHAVYLQAH
jgi:heat shock protein HspQ